MPHLKSVKLNHIESGSRYFTKGVGLLLHPQLRKYTLIPLAINCVLFFVLSTCFIYYYESVTHWLWDFLPAGLGFITTALKTIAWFLIITVFIIAYAYSFNIITNTLAAPFYGVLAQKTEELLTGKPLPDEALIKMVPRTILREIQKLIYFLLRGIVIVLLILLLSTLPIINILAPVLGLLWGAWSMTIQYSDYAADNNQTHFRQLRKKLRKRIYSSVGFGGTVMFCSMIPVVNIIAMPAAVIGGTMLWVHELKSLQRKTKHSS